MKAFKQFLKHLWMDESAQGTAEYVLLLVALVAVALIFKDRIMAAVKGRLDVIDSAMNGFNTGQ